MKKKRRENECIQELEKQLNRSLRQNDERMASDLCVELADEYRRAGNRTEALGYYRRAIKMAEKLDAYENAAFAHRAIAEMLVDPNEAVLVAYSSFDLPDDGWRKVDTAGHFKSWCDHCLHSQLQKSAVDQLHHEYRPSSVKLFDRNTVELLENTKALQHGLKYLKAAEKSGRVDFIQLAYHVLGWLYLQIYLNSDAEQETLLEKGKHWCERSLMYLSQHAVHIDADNNAVRMGQDSRSRKARLQQVLSQICDKLKLRGLALRYHNAAMAYAARAGDHDLQYRCLLSKLNFDGDQRLKTAIELSQVAVNLDQQASCEAMFILAQEKIRVKDFVGAKWNLISMLASKEYEKLDSEEQNSFSKLLITVYKTVERLKTLGNADEDLKMKINEKIADSMYEVEFPDISIEFYKQMLKYASKIEDRIKALVSIAETAKELDRYNEAYDCFIEVDVLENSLNISEAKRADTAICIAGTAAKMNSLSTECVWELFRKAEHLAVGSLQKKTLYDYMLEYAKKHNMNEDLHETEAKMKNLGDVSNESDGNRCGSDDYIEADFVDQWDQMSDTQILARCKEDASRQSMEERIRLEKDKKINVYGETRMHEAARGNDKLYLKMLIKMGYNVNAQDEGGWTPLHEAVGALKLENVRILLQNGANINLRSNAGTLSADGEQTDSGGLTPLMEACDRGATAIVNLLLQFGADVTIKSRDDWTALDFLRNAMKLELVEDETMEKAKQLISLMEKKLKKANIAISAEPPPKKLKSNSKLKLQSNSESLKILDPNLINLREYQKTMNVVGRGATHDRSAVLLNSPEDDRIFDEGIDVQANSREIEPTFDDVLFEIDGLAEADNDSKVSSGSCSLPISSSFARRKQSFHSETKRSPPLIRSKMRGASDIYYDEVPSSSNSVAVPLPSVPTAKVSLRQKKDENRIHTESFLEDSGDDEPVLVLRSRALNTPCVEDKTNRVGDISLRGNRIEPLQSQNTKNRANSKQAFDAPTTSEQSVSKNQIFVKIIIKKNDGTRFKTKGMPFACSCTIGDIRKRCEEELKHEIIYTSLILCHDDCELSDDTPLELVLANSADKVLECIISGCTEPSASLIYAKRAKNVMSNVLRALDESVNGYLDLREMCIGEDDAVCAAIETFTTNVMEVYLDGNTLSSSFISSVSKILRYCITLSVACCGLHCRTLRQLIGDRIALTSLSKLNISFNNFGGVDSDHLGSFISLCSNLVHLNMSFCCLNQNTADELVRHIKKMISLEVLDLSFNSAVNSNHASELIEACKNLKQLDLSHTSVTEINIVSEEKRKLEVLKLSFNNLLRPENVVQWSIRFCTCMVHLDLSATTADSTVIESCLKLKANKHPFLTVLLSDCAKLETEVTEVVDTLKAILTTDSTVKFKLTNNFRNEIENLLPHSYRFCLE